MIEESNMSAKHRDERAELARILDGVVDSILEAPEEEIDGDLRALGEDPEKAAMRARQLALAAVQQHRTGRRESARRQFDDQQQALEAQSYDLPGTPELRFALLTAAVRGKPWLGDMLTVEHRQLRSLPDEDVISYLRQLAELGVLDEL